jgi:acyl-CoA synthetase (AMP-forming)/AMP-acid ligase II
MTSDFIMEKYKKEATGNGKNPEPTDFLALVRQTVEMNPAKTFASWYGSNGQLSVERSFGEIWEEAGRIAHFLHHEWKVEKGQRVVLCYDFGLSFFEAFFGCLRAGVTAVMGEFFKKG